MYSEPCSTQGLIRQTEGERLLNGENEDDGENQFEDAMFDRFEPGAFAETAMTAEGGTVDGVDDAAASDFSDEEGFTSRELTPEQIQKDALDMSNLINSMIKQAEQLATCSGCLVFFLPGYVYFVYAS